MLVVMCAKVIRPNMVMWGDHPLQGSSLIHEVHVCWVCVYTHVGVWGFAPCSLVSPLVVYILTSLLTSCMSLCASVFVRISLSGL